MKIGLISDTHDIDDIVIKHIIREFREVHEVECVFHMGDIERQHLNAELFGNFPVVCVLNAEQLEKDAFKIPPPGWQFTTPGDRIRDIGGVRFYIGHRFSSDMAKNPGASFKAKLNVLREQYDGLRFACAGHMHHQTTTQQTTPLVTFINPGAVQFSPDGYEFAVLDTKTNQIFFSRIPTTKYLESPFTVGIISDSLNISKLDADFWKKLAQELKDRDVSQVIHCGNIALPDIGREEFASFQVYYRLRNDQFPPRILPPNWYLIPKDPPIVTINERQFYVHPSLARVILEKSEADMHRECLMISESYPEISFILYGNATDVYLSEELDGRTRIMNPGNALSRSFATVCFPKCGITLAKVSHDPLPPIE